MRIHRNISIVYLFIIVLSFIAVFSFNVNKAEALDLGRYYQQAAENALMYNSILSFIPYQVEVNVDFIYQTALYSAARNGISLSFVTVFFVSLFYISSYKLINSYWQINNFKYTFLIFILTLCPVIWILTISRTTAALSFFFIGCKYLNENRFGKSAVFYLIAVFTHVSVLIFIALVLFALALAKFKYRKARSVLLLAVSIVGYIIPTIIMDVISPYIELLQSRYVYYAEMEMQSPLLASSLGVGDKIPIVFIYIFLLYLLINDKRTDWTYWMLYVCWCLLSFFIWSDVMMTNRIIMLAVPFVGISFYHLLCCSKNRKRLQSIAYWGILIAIGSLYTYRTVF